MPEQQARHVRHRLRYVILAAVLLKALRALRDHMTDAREQSY